jgi:hypothetical protein
MARLRTTTLLHADAATWEARLLATTARLYKPLEYACADGVVRQYWTIEVAFQGQKAFCLRGATAATAAEVADLFVTTGAWGYTRSRKQRFLGSAAHLAEHGWVVDGAAWAAVSAHVARALVFARAAVDPLFVATAQRLVRDGHALRCVRVPPSRMRVDRADPLSAAIAAVGAAPGNFPLGTCHVEIARRADGSHHRRADDPARGVHPCP